MPNVLHRFCNGLFAATLAAVACTACADLATTRGGGADAPKERAKLDSLRLDFKEKRVVSSDEPAQAVFDSLREKVSRCVTQTLTPGVFGIEQYLKSEFDPGQQRGYIAVAYSIAVSSDADFSLLLDISATPDNGSRIVLHSSGSSGQLKKAAATVVRWLNGDFSDCRLL